ncbi:MAG: hypothetical protein A2785_00845 [Candidatus Chisholmbacteria bacterium RIFCSPHIGHO2_01_FULL_49_18]|uniref:Uncharacterized protein n=2 Tax=Candidatus Chisholmiibacteriota TaxID=1817900 RepID=A0A1G1VL36_9BACT|nr:MAG: hypothetical protein A2785_00845 [Candidatus Chisholmbacteria bacterium RIFCSPHIGHO2_01_FULL_49_18]OGY22217.1 MAG: hypothetical protein A3A65_04975 [Candidatus Chisholmbacteria bacterium RIFCSPLOWO2_01_FULL_49_14]
MIRFHSPEFHTLEPYYGGSKGDSPWFRWNIRRETGQVEPDRQGVKPLGNELLVNEFIIDWFAHQCQVPSYHLDVLE